ncbi:hypothetical protein C5167_022518 [Papaver somniferum]|uniref:Uncharacterized protein n=1 Tax=Papaver somniferum TaxID=3469 RepID=A0A4Y7JLU3_PAPSO|nr:hypothetical protein C5167_022518 [Papaver somniferum]
MVMMIRSLTIEKRRIQWRKPVGDGGVSSGDSIPEESNKLLTTHGLLNTINVAEITVLALDREKSREVREKLASSQARYCITILHLHLFLDSIHIFRKIFHAISIYHLSTEAMCNF